MFKNTKIIGALSIALALSPIGNLAYADATPLIGALSQNEEGVPSLAPLIEKAVPAVVNISVNGKKSLNQNALDIPDEFKFFFPEIQKERKFSALGSGVIINAEKGLVITNYHVVDGADDIKVTLHDGRVLKASVKGQDEQTDFALLELESPKNLTELKFADSDNLKVGDFAIAIGNPFGLGQTVTSGIISALGRSGLNIENYENFIQTDAAINSGNSGGALINLKGELIGINTAILGRSGGNIGIGFAIPSNMAHSIVDQLIANGKVSRGLLGITGTEVNEDLAKNFDYHSVNGAFVNEVLKDSAADKAGIKSGDILTSINGVKISNFGQLRAKIATLGAGAKVKIGIFRDGKEKEVEVTLDGDKGHTVASNSSNPLFEGATLSDNDGKGVLVSDVKDNSRAARYGLAKGDIITEANREKVNSMDDLNKILSKKNKFLALKINRKGMTVYLTSNY
ncbi:MAG: DegQ family serine endoprotease [Ruminobacter sp.]|jgi:serine protease Do/serine protease DegQ|uniref:Serine protease Do n=1 Tax=Ruminobacter amylophilus TaxID=867 RepID=A0A662ZIG3_9GAMM|nr:MULTISPECIES: DegQ family serine endoprotease [Ruminobacter]MBQ3774628.1 DegQ family serine endoprotease [Ruminobacter sp.]SFP34732.1 serine protease Do [Ruminobacter amylophilus]